MADRRQSAGRRVTDIIGGFLQVKNWREFQHYKHRNPPWIRLHRRMLDDKDFHKLPLASRALAPMLWLLASESVDGTIKWDVEEIAFRLRTTEQDVLDAITPLVATGFFAVLADDKQPASVMLAPCLLDATTETETETEKAKATPPKSGDVPDWIPMQEWQDFCEMRKKIRAPLTSAAQTIAINTLAKLKAQGHNPAEILQQSVMHSWRGLFEPRSNGNGQPRQSAFDRMETEARQAD